MQPCDNVVNISAKIAPFIRAMMDSGECDKLDYGMVIDIYQLLPQDFVKYIDGSICDIYYFITPEVTAQESYEILKSYDTLNDYTYYLSDKENIENCISIVEVSKLLKEQCLKFDLPYFGISTNRKNVISSFVEYFN